MTTGWRALGVVLTVGTTIPASAQELATWRPVETAPAAAHLAELLPAGAYTVDARAGDLLRLVGGSRPTVGRLWRSGDAYAFVDESDRLVPDGSAWRFLVPLGTHELVVVAGARRAERVGVARATRVTVGYEWEVYEDALVDWGDGASTAPPPAPPSGSAGAAWSEADAVSTLLADAGALDRGGRSLRTAVALDGVARARAMVGPYYREAGRALVRVVEPGTPTSAKLRGPLLVRVTARSARPAGRQVAARVRVDGLPVVAADAPVGPSGPAELPGALGPPVELTARIPAGEHLVSVEALGGPAHVTVEPFRKRHHVADAFSGDESIDGRARALMAAGAPIVAAEARRLGGDLAGARAAFIRLEGASSPAVRVLAAWRAAELATDADDAAAAFNRAMSAAAQLSAGSRDRVVPALAAARLRRAAVDGEPASRAAADVAALAALWTDPRAAAALAEGAGSVDRGEAVARLAAAVAAEPFDAGALRRAFFDRTVWSGAAESSRAEQLVLVRDDDQGACADVDRTAIGYLRVGDRPLTVEVPADPLGSSRFLTGRVAAFAPDGPALEAELLVDGQPVPLPVVAAAEDQRVAIAPGRHTIGARGGARLYLHLPGAQAADEGPCDRERYRRRRYAEIAADDARWTTDAPGGALLGLELRLLEPLGRQTVEGVLTVDGARRPIVLRISAEIATVASAARPVSGALVIDSVFADPASLRLRRTDGGSGVLLARPLVRVPQAAALARRRAIAGAPRPTPPSPPSPSSAGAGGDLRRLSTAIAAAEAPGVRASLYLARARVLAAGGRIAYAEEDLRRAAELIPGGDAARLLEWSRAYVDADPDTRAYPIDPTAPLLSALRADPAARRAAAAARAGAPRRADTSDDATLALIARLGDAQRDAASGAAVYTTLARRHPEDRRLAAAEADRRLDAAAVAEPAPGASTRAYLAALRAVPAPGSGAALARATDATRWRPVTHAEQAAGSLRAPQPAAPVDAGAAAVRAALVAPDLDVDDAVWLEPGQVARAVVTTSAPVRLELDARCAELRPAAAAERQTGGETCRFQVRIDGRDVTVTSRELGVVPAGARSVEIELLPGGLDVHAAVRLLTDRSLGEASLPVRGGRWRLGARVDENRFLADADDPVQLAVLGPTALRLEVAGEGPLVIGEAKGTLATVEPRGGAGRAEIALPEERPYLVELRPTSGRAAVAAFVREDRAAPTLAPDRVAVELEEPSAEAPPARPAPRAPATALRLVSDPGELGTLTVGEDLRQGHVGDRDTDAGPGGRYAETTVTYRRRTADVFWRVDALGRLRRDGNPSGGFGARAYCLLPGELRFAGGALGFFQDSATGTLITGYLDAALSLRRPIGRDLFITPSLGGLLREGPVEDPGGDAIDPDVWSQFDADRPRQLWAALRLDHETFLDLHLRARLRLVTVDVEPDRAGAQIGLSGALNRFSYDVSFELERRFENQVRLTAFNQPIVRVAAGYGIWRGANDRLSLHGGVALRPGDRVDAFLGFSYDWTFGRGLADFAPDESEYAAQLGPYAQERDR